MTDAGTLRLPTYFISHGGGPWPWIMDQMPFDMRSLQRSLQAMPKELGVTPRAVLCVTAHWIAPEFTVQTSPKPGMLYDYGGFPEFTYHIQYPAPGSPEVAQRVVELLQGSGVPVREDPIRGFDHGTFAPLYVAYPNADMPIVQLSIKRGFSPDAHLALGRALAPLRDEGVLIVGSGLSYHNLGLFGPGAEKPSRQFDDWLTDAMDADPITRTEALRNWEMAPSARVCHPAEDHLIPLMVAVGAAEDEAATCVYHDAMDGFATASGFRFGSPTH